MFDKDTILASEKLSNQSEGAEHPLCSSVINRPLALHQGHYPPWLLKSCAITPGVLCIPFTPSRSTGLFSPTSQTLSSLALDKLWGHSSVLCTRPCPKAPLVMKLLLPPIFRFHLVKAFRIFFEKLFDLFFCSG